MLFISTDPKIMSGKPVIKGTRIPVSRIIFLLSDGYTLEMISDEYPHVSLVILKGVINELMKSIDQRFYAQKAS